MQVLLEFLYYVSPAIVGVLLGGYLVNRFFVRKANLAALVERACDCLNQLRDDCAEYWSVDFSAEKQARYDVLEAKIKAQVLQINTMLTIISDKYGEMPIEMSERILGLQDACTGGDFESRQRKADKRRFMRIVSLINKLAVGLQRLKI